MNQPVAVWDGRFQPLHKGHVEVVLSILEQFPSDLALMIIDCSTGLRENAEYESNSHHKVSRNPLSYWERSQMMKSALKEVGCSRRVTVTGMPRPDLHWDLAKRFYPEHGFICLTEKDEYERLKRASWQHLGEETRVIDTSSVSSISSTEVKRALKRGRGWRQLLPEDVVEYFIEIGGPRRFSHCDL